MTHQHAFARTDRTKLGVWWWTTDHWLLGAVTVLIAMGAFLSFAASPGAAARTNHEGQVFYYAIRQCAFALGGLITLVWVSMLSPRGVRRLAFFTFLIAILVMMALPFIGHEAKGATRWLRFGGFSLQPSEFMKPALIVLAAWMFAEGQKGEGVPGVIIAFGLYFLAVILLTIERDFGQTVLITSAFMAAFFMAGVPLIWIVGLGGLAMAGGVAMALSSDHVQKRLHGFFSPDAAGANTHQVDSAHKAISAGGLFGSGPGEGVMKTGVPDAHTDFIYSVAAEEYGLIFSLALIGLFAFVVLRGLTRTMRLSDPFEQVAAAGLFVLLGQQACINVAVNLNLIPTKGMTLPFISYGGSSMLAMGLTLGMALALTRRRPGSFAHADEPARDADFD